LSRGAKYVNFPKMIVQIVIVIVTAVQVNSQELCPSVCKCDGEQAACTNLFSDVTDMTQHRFHSALKELRVYGTGVVREADVLQADKLKSCVRRTEC
jgi:hypothetical protein